MAQVVGGLLLLITGTLAMLAARQGRTVRQPAPAQRDDIANPIASIAVRHLPLDMIGPDLADATQAAVAIHSYLMDGPLLHVQQARQTPGEFAPQEGQP